MADNSQKKPEDGSQDDPLLQPLDQIGPPPEGLEEDFGDAPPDEAPSQAGANVTAGVEDLLPAKQKGGTQTNSIATLLARMAPDIYVRARAFRPDGQDLFSTLGMDAACWRYLHVSTFQHMMEDDQRDPDQRLYDWSALHLDGIREALAEEVLAKEDELRAQGRRDRTQTILRLIAGCKSIPEAMAQIRGLADA